MVPHDTTIGWRFINPQIQARYGTDSMPGTAQTLAREHAIHRVEQDSFALRSQARTAAAKASGRLVGEILPVTVPLGRGRTAEVVKDEHPRATTLADLAGLRPITGPDGSVTASDTSGVNDGATALIVASAVAIRGHGLTPGARLQCEGARQGGWNGDRSGKRQDVDEPVR